MKTVMSMLIGGRVASNKTRSQRPRSRTLEMECLEARLVPTTVNAVNVGAVNAQQVLLADNTVHAILDFDGGDVSSAAMSNGGWSTNGDPFSVKSFRGLFNQSNPWLDFSGDGHVNSGDFQIAVQRILAKVKADYAPYRIDINLGKHADNEARLTDGQVGDVIVMITGGQNNIDGQSAFGISPSVDHGNQKDEIAWVFGETIVNSRHSANQFLNGVARTISHEMGHCFGLEHVVVNPNNDASTHLLMGVPAANGGETRDFDHDFNFQDISYQVVGGGTQNEHQILSSTLGVSSGPWIAVLKPGQLTITGTDGADTIRVTQSIIPNRWNITINNVTQSVDFFAPGANSLNPFDASLTRINVFGKDGDDTIVISPSLTVNTVIFGGRGIDTIYGGSGKDEIHGGDDNDYIDGRSGNDQLFGDNGRDVLHGGIGNDRLDGGFDGISDVLRGEQGTDTFVIHKNWNFGNSYIEEVEDTDFLAGIDIRVFQYHQPVATTSVNA